MQGDEDVSGQVMQVSGQGASGSRSGSLRSSGVQEGERQDWGQLMPLSPVGGPLQEYLSRSNSEDWELLPENPKPAQSEGDAAAEEVQVRLVSGGGDAVTVSITPVASPLQSPRRSETPEPPEAFDAGDQAAAAQQLAAATGADGSASPSPLSGSAHSFEHLSDHFALPSSGSNGEPVFASDGEPVSGSDADAVALPPSLPDLEALPEHEAGDSLASSAMTGGNGGGGGGGGSTSEVGLEASFAEQLQMAAAGLGGGGGGLGGAGSLAVSFASSGVHQLAGGSQGASPLGSSYSDLAASAASGAGASWEAHPVLQQALAHLEAGEQEITAAAAAQGAGAGSDPDSQADGLAVDAAGSDDSFLASLKSYLSSRMPSAALTRLWDTLQDWGRVVYMRMPALPPQLAQPAAFMGKRLRCMDWQRAALGASMASVAMLSFLLYSSYTTNRRLRAALGRKETDLLQLISRVVSLQRDMLRPRAVPIIRHTGTGACAWAGMDII